MLIVENLPISRIKRRCPCHVPRVQTATRWSICVTKPGEGRTRTGEEVADCNTRLSLSHAYLAYFVLSWPYILNIKPHLLKPSRLRGAVWKARRRVRPAACARVSRDEPLLPALLPESPACPPSCSQLPASCKLTKKVPGRRVRA